MLTDDQKRTRLDNSKISCLAMMSRYEDDPGNFIHPVGTQDETWVHHCDIARKSRKTYLWYSALAGQRLCTHVTS